MANLNLTEQLREFVVLEQVTEGLIDGGNRLGAALVGTPVGAALNAAQDAVVGFITSVYPEFPALVEDFAKTYRYPYHDHVQLPLLNLFHVVLILTIYLVLVYGGIFVMKHFSKFELRWYGAVHNLVLTLLSLYMSVEIFRQALVLGYSFAGNTGNAHVPGYPTEKEHGMMKILWVFYVSKILEMIDTLLMVLKKNFHQISFLHVYHHATIFLIWWFIIYGYPCGDSYFSASQNSFVHVIMYTYYFFSTLKIQVPFKVVVTYIQMLQFVMNVTQACYYLFYLKKEPALPMQILLVYCLSLLALFYNYLVQSQKKAKKARNEGNETKEKKRTKKD